jgi:hypothetical protein
MTLTSIERRDVGTLGTEFANALKAVGDKYGIDITPFGGRYGGLEGEVKLKVKVRRTVDLEASKKAEFAIFCKRFDFVPEDYDRKFYYKGHQWRIVGINPGAPTYPIQCERVYDKKGSRFPGYYVKQLLGAKQAA